MGARLHPAGGGDLGEIDVIAHQKADPDDDEYFDIWSAAAQRHADAADAAAASGHRATARSHYLRAASFLTVAYHPLYGAPIDPRLADAFERQMIAFDRAMSLGTPPAEPLSFPFEGHEMLGYFIPAADAQQGERRPLVIATNGFDATIPDMYLATAHYAVQRGYHCLVFDGPGQGSMLVRDGVSSSVKRRSWSRWRSSCSTCGAASESPRRRPPCFSWPAAGTRTLPCGRRRAAPSASTTASVPTCPTER